MLTPVILCGGSGTRLWPLSRNAYPKHLLSFTEQSTMLQATIQRAMALQNDANLQVMNSIIITNEDHRFLVHEQIESINHIPTATYLEPVGRNTAPAIALAALHLSHGTENTPPNPDALMLVLPADHVIGNPAAFVAAVTIASQAATAGHLVTFGIIPKGPEVGYGYIQAGETLNNNEYIRAVTCFIEKPDAATAQHLINSGDYYWNSGIFLFTARNYLEELQRYRPDIARIVTTAWRGRTQDGDFCRPNRDAFISCPSESIDYAIMQKTCQAAVIPVNMDWSDVGSWESLWSITSKDDNGNALLGDVYLHDTANSYVRSESRLVAVIGLQDIVVVETPDAVLVMHKNKSQDVKHATAYFAKQQRKEQLIHRRVYRPWGWYEGIDAGNRFQVKRIMVSPGAKLSLQMHHHRAEHWIVVSGTAKVTINGEETLLAENQSTYIPLGYSHRLENPGKLPLHLIEVQSGSYLGEDDIVRFDDSYGRK